MSPSNTCQKPWSKWHKKIHAFLQNYPSLLPKESFLLLAISGGQDSMALLRLILDLQRIYKWKIFVWHGDHGWHSQSTIVKEQLEAWCNKQNLEFFSDQTNQEVTKTEEKARDWRYSCLVKRAKNISKRSNEISNTFVITGHTGSDRAETLLLNLSRGTDISGLGSMPKCRFIDSDIKLVRPLLCLSREETAIICEELNLPIWLDPSNQNKTISRNQIRLEIIPRLEKLYPGCSLRIAELSERISSYRQEQEFMTKFILKSMRLEEGISREILNEFPDNTKAKILICWIKSNQAPCLSTRSLKELIRIIGSSKPKGFFKFGKEWEIKWGKYSIEINKLEIN